MCFNVTGFDVHFGVICPSKPRPIARVIAKVEKHGVEVQSVELPGEHIKSMFIIRVRVSPLINSFLILQLIFKI